MAPPSCRSGQGEDSGWLQGRWWLSEVVTRIQIETPYHPVTFSRVAPTRRVSGLRGLQTQVGQKLCSAHLNRREQTRHLFSFLLPRILLVHCVSFEFSSAFSSSSSSSFSSFSSSFSSSAATTAARSQALPDLISARPRGHSDPRTPGCMFISAFQAVYTGVCTCNGPLLVHSLPLRAPGAHSLPSPHATTDMIKFRSTTNRITLARPLSSSPHPACFNRT